MTWEGCVMQAGAAWPKLKPFVLELLTTLVGKQVSASRRADHISMNWRMVQLWRFRARRTRHVHGCAKQLDPGPSITA